jgi:hypothetical protein
MMMMKTIRWAMMAGALALGTGCGEASIGDACETAGAADGECEDGAVCGQSSDVGEILLCQKLCVVQADCQITESCSGISGSSLKGCRPK